MPTVALRRDAGCIEEAGEALAREGGRDEMRGDCKIKVVRVFVHVCVPARCVHKVCLAEIER